MSCRRSIFGRCGSWANAPTKSLASRLSSPARHRSYGPSGSNASAFTAWSWMRERVSPLMMVKSGSPPMAILNACTSFFSDTVTTMQYACWIVSVTRSMAAFR